MDEHEHIEALIERFKETGAAVSRIERLFREAFEEDSTQFTPTLIEEHIAAMRRHYARTEQSYQRISKSDYNSPILLQYKEVMAERLRERDVVLAYWEQALRSRLS